MSDSLVHEDLFALLGLELRWSPDELRQMLAHNPGSASWISDEIERSDFSDLELVLAEPVVDPSDGGAPLVAANVRLTRRKFQSLLTRQANKMETPLGPFVIQPSEGALRHYRQKIATRLGALVERIRNDKGSTAGTIHKMILNSRELACIQEYFEELADGAFGAPHMLPQAVPIIADGNNDSVLLNSINAAFVGMALRMCYQPFHDAPTRKAALMQIGTAALLQDFSRLLDPAQPDTDHPAASEHWARECGLPAEVTELIGLHHSLVDSDGTPLLKSAEGLSTQARVLIATNVFLGEIRGKAPGQNFESMKSLSYLADMHMVDRRAVQILSRLYLPKLKAAVIGQTAQLTESCPVPAATPILWPITGDKIPSVFLCQMETCEHRTTQLSHLATEIPFVVDGQTLSTIDAGDYFTCPFLTGRLRALYAAIKSRMNQ